MIFDRYLGLTLTANATISVVAAPGAGLAIYLQSLNVNDNGAAGNTFVIMQDGGGTQIAVFIIQGGTFYDRQYTYPGGLKLAANSALRGQCGATAVGLAVTYTIGPA